MRPHLAIAAVGLAAMLVPNAANGQAQRPPPYVGAPIGGPPQVRSHYDAKPHDPYDDDSYIANTPSRANNAPSANKPYRANNPYSLNPSNNPYSLHPSRNPYNLQSPNNPYRIDNPPKTRSSTPNNSSKTHTKPTARSNPYQIQR